MAHNYILARIAHIAPLACLAPSDPHALLADIALLTPLAPMALIGKHTLLDSTHVHMLRQSMQCNPTDCQQGGLRPES